MTASGGADVEVRLGDDAVATVELRRGPSNYFDVELIGAVADAYERLADDDGCRGIVLCAEGRNFCAGADLRGRGGAPGASFDPADLYEEAARLVACPLPVVAAVQGAAVGGGLGLACTADARVAERGARFRANFARLGIHHGFGLTATLPRIVGAQRARLLLLGGRELGAETALEWGLCDVVAEAAGLRDTARTFAAELGGGAPLATRSIKATLDEGFVDAFRAATAAELAAQRCCFATEDFAEGVAAAEERRDPRFVGR